MSGRLVLLSPDLRYGRGTGHLMRCLEIASRRPDRYVLHIPNPPAPGNRSREELTHLDGLGAARVESRPAPWPDYEAVVYDRRSAEAAELCEQSISIGVDLGGTARARADYLLDSLPMPRTFGRPNRFASGLRSAPHRRRETPDEIQSVLLSFGGEDPTGLTGTLAAKLRRAFRSLHVTLVKGPANNTSMPPGFDVLVAPSNLKERLADYDLVVTSFGLTAFEALAAGCAVVTFNPTRYHEALSRIAGFASIGVRRPNLRRLARLMERPASLTEQSVAARSKHGSDLYGKAGEPLDQVIDQMRFTSPPSSPVTGDRGGSVVARFADRTYYRCAATSLIYLHRFDAVRMNYEHDYFFSEYAAQYGRTYLDDFEHIRTLAVPRIEIIRRRAPTGALLDVGCAFGPFLAESTAAGYDAHGLDVSREAVAHVRSSLRLPAVVGDFSSFSLPRLREALGHSRFDVVTMWYVIEHFEDLRAVLRNVNRLLPVGGVFAFATPNASGISGRRSLRHFLEAGPIDHYSVWDPKSAKSVLRRFGFSVYAMRSTGHHPERFGHRFARPRTVPFRAAGFASRAFGLGDTFEVYCEKRGEVTDD